MIDSNPISLITVTTEASTYGTFKEQPDQEVEASPAVSFSAKLEDISNSSSLDEIDDYCDLIYIANLHPLPTLFWNQLFTNIYGILLSLTPLLFLFVSLYTRSLQAL